VARTSFDVDHAYCISLTERADRRWLFRQTVESLITNRIEFHLTERCSDPVRGCYESHQALARKALAEGWDRILIFEDDAQPYDLHKVQIRWVNRFVREQPFQALHLGYSMGRTWMTWFPFIARGKVVALHAYILSREGCQILADAPYCGVPVDVVFKRRIKQHCVFPMLFRQHAAVVTGSDIEKVGINEDEWWARNWKRHKRSVLKNLWRTVLRVGF
jgi:glycosyl transferase, family 25